MKITFWTKEGRAYINAISAIKAFAKSTRYDLGNGETITIKNADIISIEDEEIEEEAVEEETMTHYYTEEEMRSERIKWRLDRIDDLEPGKAAWCKDEALRLFYLAVDGHWTNDDGTISCYDSWLDTITDMVLAELENWEARRCAELGA